MTRKCLRPRWPSLVGNIYLGIVQQNALPSMEAAGVRRHRAVAMECSTPVKSMDAALGPIARSSRLKTRRLASAQVKGDPVGYKGAADHAGVAGRSIFGLCAGRVADRDQPQAARH